MSKVTELRGLGSRLDEVMRILKDKQLGSYKLNKNDNGLIEKLLIISNLIEWQELSNIGVKINNTFGNYTLELYNYRVRQQEIDKTIEDFYL